MRSSDIDREHATLEAHATGAGVGVVGQRDRWRSQELAQ